MLENLLHVRSMVGHVGVMYRYVALMDSHPNFLALDDVGSQNYFVRIDQEARSITSP